MTKMKAALLEAYDQPFRITELDRPVPAEGEVLVRIAASGVNPLDSKIRSGKAAHARHPLPAVLGIDVAGTIEQVGPGVTSFHVGEEVYGMTGGVGSVQGSLAQYAAIDARLLAPKPSNFSMREAAALPLTFITAWEGLVDRIDLQPGQTLLVIGSGGVGMNVIQIGVALGATVYAVDSGTKADTIRSLGATPIDYQEQAVEDYVKEHTNGKGFDVVYDTIGGAGLDAAFAAVTRFGHVTSCLGWGAHSLAPLSFKGASYSGVFTLMPLLDNEGRAHHGDIMRKATQLAEAGKLSVKLDPRNFGLTDVLETHNLLENRLNEGKLVISISH